MENCKISVDLSELLNMNGQLLAEIFPLVTQAVGAIAQQAQIQWKDGVKQARLWSGEKNPYINSITWKMTGQFSAEVMSDYDLAYEIENGRPAKDLKKMLDTSQKVRTTKDGRRFMVIPFRHNTPGNDALAGSMPPDVYGLASKMEKSSVTGQSERASGEVTDISPKMGMQPSPKQAPFASNPSTQKPLMVPRHHYSWGDRLPAGMVPKMKPEHKTDIYAGMVRMQTSVGEKKSSSSYMTFRVMMEGSSGWIIPPRPGMQLVPKITEQLQPVAEAAFAEAVKRTFAK